MVPGTIVVYRRKMRWGRKGLWAWRLVAANGNIIATDGGQGYYNKQDAVTMATKIIGGTFYAASAWQIEGDTE